MVRSECFLDCLTMTREQIDAEHPSVGEDVAASVPITLSEEGEKQVLGLKPAPRLEQVGDEHSERVQDRKHRSE